jgi:phosphonopyruvate decarboxylase
VIDPRTFVDSLRRHGVSFVSGVPCSYLGALLAELSAQREVQVLNAANEGEAVAACAGAALAGCGALAFMQNSGLGNAVSPLSSLAEPFRIPLLLVVTLRGEPQRSDEPQHRLMGAITGNLLDLLEIPWEPLPSRSDDVDAALARAQQHMKSTGRPFAWIAPADGFESTGRPWGVPDRTVPRTAPAVVELLRGRAAGMLPSRADALELVVRRTPEDRALVIGSTGYTSRELYACADRANHFYMVGSMGCASALGLGLACARPDVEVVVVEGDGSALMRLGSFAMIGAQAGRNLVHVVLDNAVHESTGAQPSLSPGVRFAEIARASGYGFAVEGDSLDVLDAVFAARPLAGPRFAHLRIRRGTRAALPRPHASPEALRQRFARHLDALRPES